MNIQNYADFNSQNVNQAWKIENNQLASTELQDESSINIYALRACRPIQLAELDDEKSSGNACNPCYRYRTVCNLAKAGSAAALSTIGAIIAGNYPTTLGIIGGGTISGVGNGASTFLAWGKKRENLIKARIIEDFPVLILKVALMNDKILELITHIEDFKTENGEQDNSLNLVKNTSIQEDRSFFMRTRLRRNCIKLFVAGAFSGAGGWWGGFQPNLLGILGGSILGGIGNGLSTWLAYEQKNDEYVRYAALNLLPNLVKITEEKEQELIQLIERIKIYYPEINFDLEKENINVDFMENKESSTDNCCLLNTRLKRNITYVNVATWMSGSGGWIGGFFPNAPGILIGGTLGAAANAISTWLAWEKVDDKEIERIALQDFDKVVLKINEISHQILQINQYLEQAEKQWA